MAAKDDYKRTDCAEEENDASPPAGGSRGPGGGGPPTPPPPGGAGADESPECTLEDLAAWITKSSTRVQMWLDGDEGKDGRIVR